MILNFLKLKLRHIIEFSKIKIKAQQNQLKNLTQSIMNRLEQASPLEIKLEESNHG